MTKEEFNGITISNKLIVENDSFIHIYKITYVGLHTIGIIDTDDDLVTQATLKLVNNQVYMKCDADYDYNWFKVKIKAI